MLWRVVCTFAAIHRAYNVCIGILFNLVIFPAIISLYNIIYLEVFVRKRSLSITLSGPATRRGGYRIDLPTTCDPSEYSENRTITGRYMKLTHGPAAFTLYIDSTFLIDIQQFFFSTCARPYNTYILHIFDFNFTLLL